METQKKKLQELLKSLADEERKDDLITFEELGIDSMIVPSLCGVDEYANNKRLYSAPGQLMLVFNEREGKDATYQIKLN